MHKLEERIKIIGIGNILYGDDGLGPEMINLMKDLTLPQNPLLISGETDSWYSLEEALTADRLIIIDAIQDGQEPGTIYVQELSGLGLNGPVSLSPHHCSLLDLLILFPKDRSLKGWLVGMEPQYMRWGRGLSPAVLDKIDLLVETVRNLLLSITVPTAGAPETAGQQQAGGPVC